jgi:hypothetical protein
MKPRNVKNTAVCISASQRGVCPIPFLLSTQSVTSICPVTYSYSSSISAFIFSPSSHPSHSFDLPYLNFFRSSLASNTSSLSSLISYSLRPGPSRDSFDPSVDQSVDQSVLHTAASGSHGHGGPCSTPARLGPGQFARRGKTGSRYGSS